MSSLFRLGPENAQQTWDLAIATVAIFSPLLLTGIYLIFAHRKNSTLAFSYFFVSTFCLLQVVGSAITLSAGKGSLSATAGIISQVGLSPALLSLTGFLKICAKETSLGSKFIFSSRIFENQEHIIVIVGVVLAAVGGSKLYTSPDGSSLGETLIKVGLIILLLFWVWLIVKAAMLFGERRNMSKVVILYYAICVALMFLTLLYVYRLLGVFDGITSKFSPLFGSVADKAGLSTFPTIMVAIVLEVAGLYLIHFTQATHHTEKSQGAAPIVMFAISQSITTFTSPHLFLPFSAFTVTFPQAKVVFAWERERLSSVRGLSLTPGFLYHPTAPIAMTENRPEIQVSIRMGNTYLLNISWNLNLRETYGAVATEFKIDEQLVKRLYFLPDELGQASDEEKAWLRFLAVSRTLGRSRRGGLYPLGILGVDFFVVQARTEAAKDAHGMGGRCLKDTRKAWQDNSWADFFNAMKLSPSHVLEYEGKPSGRFRFQWHIAGQLRDAGVNLPMRGVPHELRSTMSRNLEAETIAFLGKYRVTADKGSRKEKRAELKKRLRMRSR